MSSKPVLVEGSCDIPDDRAPVVAGRPALSVAGHFRGTWWAMFRHGRPLRLECGGYIVVLAFLIIGLSGCARTKHARHSNAPDYGVGYERSASFASAEASMPPLSRTSAAEPVSAQLLIRKASLSVEVSDISNAVERATAIAKTQGGYVEAANAHQGDHQYASMTIRLPADQFGGTLDLFAALGTVTHKSLSSDDVTESYIDMEARLKNAIALRERLKDLLSKAADIKDILAIETQMSRVQTDIESMEGRLKALKGKVDYATITLRFETRKILGPLGYLFKGIWWGVSKLFVIRP